MGTNLVHSCCLLFNSSKLPLFFTKPEGWFATYSHASWCFQFKMNTGRRISSQIYQFMIWWCWQSGFRNSSLLGLQLFVPYTLLWYYSCSFRGFSTSMANTVLIYDKVAYYYKLYKASVMTGDKGKTFPLAAEGNIQNTFAHGLILCCWRSCNISAESLQEISQTCLNSNLELPNTSQIYLAVVIV